MSGVSAVSRIGMGGLSFMVLSVLKLMGLIEMSWWLVLTSFIWVPLMLVGVLLLVTGIVGLVGFSVAWLIDRLS